MRSHRLGGHGFKTVRAVRPVNTWRQGWTYRLSAKRRGTSQFAGARRSSSGGGPVEGGVVVESGCNEQLQKRLHQLMPMVGGNKVLRQTISREDALIAHTRKNAYFVLQEDNLGSIQAGKLADLVVIDRDYLTVPVDHIKDIKPLLTMVGGRIVYDAASSTTTR